MDMTSVMPGTPLNNPAGTGPQAIVTGPAAIAWAITPVDSTASPKRLPVMIKLAITGTGLDG
jgi:hypothetical protein